MSEFRGFHVESKDYMGYDTMTLREKVAFWLGYPVAFVVFHYGCWKDAATPTEKPE